MSSTTKVSCDACEADLTVTGNSVDYRIVLASQSIPAAPGPVTDMMIYPELPSALHFCGLRCLKSWIVSTNI